MTFETSGISTGDDVLTAVNDIHKIPQIGISWGCKVEVEASRW